MARPRKPARLWFDKKDDVWCILDGGHKQRTGCSYEDSEGAEDALTEYLASKFVPRKRECNITEIPVAEALASYGAAKADEIESEAGRETLGVCIQHLIGFWGDKMLDKVNGENCKAYTATSGHAASTVRRRLGVLQSAINHWHKEHGPLEAVPEVTLPPAPPTKDRWLTRSEAARLLAGSLGWYSDGSYTDVATRQTKWIWKRDHRNINRHLARFIILSLRTGSRKTALLKLRWMASTEGGWIDLDRSVIHRAAEAEIETKKKKPPARLGSKIMCHVRIWRRQTNNPADFVIQWRKERVSSIKKAWATARDFAMLDGTTQGARRRKEVTPHTLRHTRATWMVQQKISYHEAGGHIGMSPRTLESRYGHHHPDWQKDAAEI